MLKHIPWNVSQTRQIILKAHAICLFKETATTLGEGVCVCKRVIINLMHLAFLYLQRVPFRASSSRHVLSVSVATMTLCAPVLFSALKVDSWIGMG
jgi:hypothetical protein